MPGSTGKARMFCAKPAAHAGAKTVFLWMILVAALNVVSTPSPSTRPCSTASSAHKRITHRDPPLRAIESLGSGPVHRRGGAGARHGGRRPRTRPPRGCLTLATPGQRLVLYEVPERLWGGRIRLLMCTNGTAERDGTRRRYGLAVPGSHQRPGRGSRMDGRAWAKASTRGW